MRASFSAAKDNITSSHSGIDVFLGEFGQELL
jgi:hypothetical protein